MARIYVAGNDLDRARKVMDDLINAGHIITYDWVAKFDEGPTKTKAETELGSVLSADLLVFLWAPNQESARYEAGMAMGLGKYVVVSGKNDSFFFQLDNIHCVGSDSEIISKINKLVQY